MSNSQMIMPFTAAFVTGLVSGTTQCAVACAPFISTYVMGSQDGVWAGVKSFTVFNAGRLMTYAVMGLVSGCFGAALFGVGEHQPFISMVFGIILVLIGVLMLIRPFTPCCRPAKGQIRRWGFISCRVAFNPTTHLLVMGMAFALIPCPPMAGILVYSLNMPSAISSSLLMLLFGLGTIFSPLFIIFVLSGWFSNKLKANAPQYKMMFQRIAAIILIFLGGSYLSGSP